MTEARRQLVLQAIVEDYVSSREPVGSKALIERHNLKVSSATVRNDMAVLEEEGLITAPHASAGRIPTEKGYRYFVDEITSPRPLTAAEKRAIHRLLGSSDSMEEVYAQTVRLLSQLTHQAAVLQYPVTPVNTIRHIELVPLAETQITVIVISDSGRVLQKIATVPAYTDEQLTSLKTALLKKLSHQPLSSLQGMASLEGFEPADLASEVLKALGHFAETEQSSKLLISGTAYLAQATSDFSSSIAPILDALEEQVTMLHLLNEMAEDARGFAVRIGTENEPTELAETSIVTSTYGSEHPTRLGVIGPTRMDYLTTTSAVRGVARYLSKILGN